MEEHPDAGELVLVAESRGEDDVPAAGVSAPIVMCRSWCWRNSEVTKLTDQTTTICLNLDFLGPTVPIGEAGEATKALADDIMRHCGGETLWHVLSVDPSEIDIGDWP